MRVNPFLRAFVMRRSGVRLFSPAPKIKAETPVDHRFTGVFSWPRDKAHPLLSSGITGTSGTTPPVRGCASTCRFAARPESDHTLGPNRFASRHAGEFLPIPKYRYILNCPKAFLHPSFRQGTQPQEPWVNQERLMNYYSLKSKLNMLRLRCLMKI